MRQRDSGCYSHLSALSVKCSDFIRTSARLGFFMQMHKESEELVLGLDCT